ncbi:MAG: uroporphyrinogen-III C-methyltransferase [Planctomycetales bacterium]|nr:uroporphyrinogen-III C-methyltransferase [Planctomycetales bacterium]
MARDVGKVYLVGAGPGDPALITLRGCEVLAQAQIVLYDYLVNPLVLSHAAADAELVCLGRHGHGRLLSQSEINSQVVAAAREGKTVVRLKGGDPAIYGRTSEEIDALEAACIPYQVVPGVTAALAASSCTGIPLTHRESASCVAFITGQECLDKNGTSLDLANLASFPGTLVFYMGVTSAERWSAELIRHGKPAETPVAVVRRCSLPAQTTTKTSLDQLAEVIAAEGIRPPAICIVGEVIAAEAKANWFASRPLFGRRILVTRPAHQATDMIRRLTSLGAEVLVQPAIEISRPTDWAPVDTAIDGLSSYDWLVFSSVNGVRFFLDRILATGRDLRQLGNARLAAIGPATTEALYDYHLKADLQPAEYRAEALAEQLVAEASGKRFLLLRASRGRELLSETLRTAQAEVEQVVVYQSEDVQQAAPEVGAALAEGQFDWVTVTSSAIARSLIRLFGDHLRKSKLAAISPLTADVLAGAGYPAAVVASQYTTDGLIDAIVQDESSA